MAVSCSTWRGVGYELTAPLGTLGGAHADDAGRVTLWVHTHVREDGPKIAVAVLGVLPSADLARVIAKRDLSALTSISGIGKKIAERLFLELRDKLPVGGAEPDVTPVQAG